MADQTPDPWKDVRRFVVTSWDGGDVSRVVFEARPEGRWVLAEELDRARAAERQQHQQENGRLRALMLADEDRIVEQAKTLRQQAAQIETLTQALREQGTQIKRLERENQWAGHRPWCAAYRLRRTGRDWPPTGPMQSDPCDCGWEGASRPTEGEQPQQERERMQKKIEQLEAILKAIPDCPMCKGEGWLMEEDGGICPACDGAPHIIGGTGKLTAKPPQLGEQGAPQ